MASREVEFHEDASLEYEAAFEWYFERSEQTALRFALEVDHGVALIAEAPQRWPIGIQNTQRFLLQRFPFAVVYRQLPGVIQVLAIAHTRRRPGYWKKRISGSGEESR